MKTIQRVNKNSPWRLVVLVVGRLTTNERTNERNTPTLKSRGGRHTCWQQRPAVPDYQFQSDDVTRPVNQNGSRRTRKDFSFVCLFFRVESICWSLCFNGPQQNLPLKIAKTILPIFQSCLRNFNHFKHSACRRLFHLCVSVLLCFCVCV